MPGEESGTGRTVSIRKQDFKSLQGTYPVIMISFADIKETSFDAAREKICQTIRNLYNKYDFLLAGTLLNGEEKSFFNQISANMKDYVASLSVKCLSDLRRKNCRLRWRNTAFKRMHRS